jgi:hemolysin activation/secretion protein
MYRWGGVVGLSHTNSDVEGDFGSFKSSGAGETYGVNYNHYLHPEGGRKTYVSAGLDEKLFKVSKINGVLVPGQQDRGSRPLTLGYTAKTETDTSVWGYGTELAVNLPGSTGNNLAAYQTEEARIQTVDWNILRLNGSYLTAWPSGWLWSMRGQMQYTESALISGEQFGLGGSSSVRGVGERVISGDKGVGLSTELTTPELTKGLRLLGFVDAGWLNSLNTAASSSGKAETDQLASLGLGLRFSSGQFSLTADWGHVVTGATLPAAGAAQSKLPRAGDEKIHVNLTARF